MTGALLTVACVEAGNYLTRGAEYVRTLAAMVRRNLDVPHRFVCLTDRAAGFGPGIETVPLEPGLRGWWNKLQLFRPGLFEGRVVYMDLDTVVVGAVGFLARDKGILHLRQWGWANDMYGSGVMVWDAGEHEAVWTKYSAETAARFPGDQDWIHNVSSWPALDAWRCVSYRYHCRKGLPNDARVVCFHGRPKPHEVAEPWVRAHWSGHGLQ